MTENELIQYLREYLQVENDLSQYISKERSIQQSLSKLKKQPNQPTSNLFVEINNRWGPSVGNWIWLIIKILFIAIITSAVLYHFVKIPTRLIAYLIGFAVTFSIAIPILILVPLFSLKKNKSHYVDAVAEHQKAQLQIPSLEKNLQVVSAVRAQAEQRLQVLKNKNILHPYYLDSYKISSLLGYLEKGRADSLKEAINLYEREQAEFERDWARDQHELAMEAQAKAQAKALSQIAEEAERQADAAEQAAQSADDAAFWSAVTAFEADKIRRDLKE